MIYKLQRKFILICTISVLSVFLLVFSVFCVWNFSTMNRNMDMLADSISKGGGRFPLALDDSHRQKRFLPKNNMKFDFINPETPFSTRHFTVFFDENGEIDKVFTDSIYSISKEQAIEYAQKVVNSGQRGWVSSYRYKVFDTEYGTGVVFIDGSISRTSLVQSITIAGIVMVSCAVLVLVLIILLSKKAVKPIAESYEKQKQFITDANHELKTPLTLILTNLDIAESELGQNEWLDDIRSEGNHMAELINQLVELSRMDEEAHTLLLHNVSFGAMIADSIAEFEPLVKARGKHITADVDANVTVKGDEHHLRKLIGILLDNAIKYCDPNGEIRVSLYVGCSVILTVENTYTDANNIDVNRLFDRFYRVDKSRTYSGSYGIGLSLAKTIVEKHHGEISAYIKDNTHIGFKVILNK